MILNGKLKTSWKSGSAADLYPFAKVLHKIPYVVIHSGLDVLGSLPLSDSQDVCEIHFCKCGSPPSRCISSPPFPLFSSSLNKSHGACEGQSAVSDIPSERSKIGCRIFPDFQVGDYNSLQSFSTAPPPLPLLFGSSVCPVPLSSYFFLVKSSALCPGSTPGCPRGEGSWRAELQIPGQAGLLAGLACHSLFKQLCSKA